MNLTIEHILDLIEKLPVNKSFDYVSGGDTKAKLVSVDRENVKVDIARLNADGTEKNASMTTDILNTLSRSIKENEPFKFDNVLNGSGNVRSTMEAIFAHTTEFYACKIDNVKHLIWVPSIPHEIGKIVNYDSIRNDIAELLNKQKRHINEKYRPYLIAIRTKPFLLLAGISGTGKSRIVRELAFKSCPEYLQDKDGTTPGNYCMIEVKPNWYDSTELLGYYSNLNMSYQFKKFVKFLVKAKMNPKVPFFVCLDEMNLAPVEQYFAEMLSIMETRKHPKIDGSDKANMEVIKTGVVIDRKYFDKFTWKNEEGEKSERERPMSDRDWYFEFFNQDTLSEEEKAQADKYRSSFTLGKEGLTLPDNVIIIGTVNMDETTHQFSRKVIDRAMTIEMNGGKLSNMFGGSKDLEYLPKDEQEKWQNSFRQLYVNADEVLEAHPKEAEDIVKKVPKKLEDINKALKGTPFEVSYRVLNELTIMVGVLLDSKKEDESLDDIINQALDRILLMKILPRIEGDSDMFNLSRDFKQKNHIEYNNRLEWLMDLAPEIVIEKQEGDNHRQTAREKIKEMIDRLENQEFTRFWP
jgi:MoxR-like ATPase